MTQGLVAVMQSDSDYFIASTISDDGHAGPAVNYPCCSVTPSGFAYNSADGVYFADIDTAPPLNVKSPRAPAAPSTEFLFGANITAGDLAYKAQINNDLNVFQYFCMAAPDSTVYATSTLLHYIFVTFGQVRRSQQQVPHANRHSTIHRRRCQLHCLHSALAGI